MAQQEAQKKPRSAFIKSFGFDDAHDPTQLAQMWFEETQDGLCMFVVFYTLACRWNQCLGCNLPSLSSGKHIDFKLLMAQTDNLYGNPEVLEKRKKIRKIILSNNGSVLDEETFSSTALIYFLAKTNMLIPNLEVLTIETRPEYVDLAELEFLARAIKEGETPTELEIAIGFEAFDNFMRNKVYRKGLSLRAFEEFARKVSSYNFRIKCYFMQKPVPGLLDNAAVKDIQNGIDYLSGMSSRLRLRINMHLNPTYVAGGTLLEHAFLRGEYQPPRLTDVARAVQHAQGKNISICVGLFDEGLAVPGGSFIRPGDEALVRALEDFNRTQNFALLD